jgi:glycosyltransferase involved in cell wall biosynthesis
VALDRIFVVQNPVDVEAVEWQASRPLLADLPQVDRPVRILLPGALLRTKGQHTAIRALRRVVDAGQDGVLWLAGDPPNHLAEGYVAWAHQLAEDLGVTDRVVWLGMRRDLPQIMKRATLVVLPTHTEGFSRAVVEAMALGRPVIGTPVGGMLDQLINGVTGLVIEVEDDAALAEGILDLTRRPDYASELAENGRRFVVRNLGVEQQTQKALAALCGPSYSRHRETSPA